VESAAIGLLAARFAAAEQRGETVVPPPPTTAHGALLAHITGGHIETIDAGPSSFQPMNVNFGLFPPLTETVAYDKDGRKFGRGSAKNLARKSAMSERALADLARWIGGDAAVAAE
jgi:methylenetetrahydrofolate--tRNA-(uracil-5-)-methyltransferase